MEGTEIKVGIGMILKDKEGRRWRIIACTIDGIRVIRMNINKTEIRTFSVNQVLDKLGDDTMVLEDDKGDGIVEISALSESTRKNYERRKALIERIKSMYGPYYAELEIGLGMKVLEDLKKEMGVGKTFIYSTIRRWLQSGMQDVSLIDGRYTKSSGKNKRPAYRSKPGRPSAHPQGIVLNEEVYAQFDEALEYYRNNRYVTLVKAYEKLLYRHYMVNDGNQMVLLPDDRIPTLRQFKNYVYSHMNAKERIVRRTSESEYYNDNRELTGSPATAALKPGDIVEVDALEADFMILSSFVDDQIVGRPIIYFMVDLFSHAIVAFSIGYDNNSRIGLSNLMLNLVDDNDIYLRRHGLDSMVGKIPFRFLPREIRTDRGSDPLSNYFADVCNELNITLSIVKGGTGSLKGSVEQSFNKFHQRWAADMFGKGYMEKRHDSTHMTQACIKMEHVVAMVTSFIIEYNNRAKTNTNFDADLIKFLELKTPMEMWRVGTEKKGGPFPITGSNFSQILNSLKFKDTATISSGGVEYMELEYIPSREDTKIRELIRRSKQYAGKRNKDGSLKNNIPIRYDPRCIDSISVILDGEPHVCYLKTSSSGNISGISFVKYTDLQKCNKELERKGIRHNLEQGVVMAGFTEKIAETVVLERSGNKPVKTGIREARRQEQFKSYAETAIDKRLDDAEGPSLPPVKIEEPDNSVLPKETNLTKEDVAGNLEEPTEKSKNSEELKEDKTLEDLQEELLSLFYKGRRRD